MGSPGFDLSCALVDPIQFEIYFDKTNQVLLYRHGTIGSCLILVDPVTEPAVSFKQRMVDHQRSNVDDPLLLDMLKMGMACGIIFHIAWFQP